ncbi:diguanylate cyclase [Rhodanobacter sp. Si-c]|uniref:diguanylate cyclase n=1 Tax=Rhodanobacter lycopersici TaxID=3162487 RepID=A0ABV3QFA0_9GAMM
MGKRDEGLRFVSLAHRLRALGLGLGMLPVAAVLYRQQAPLWLWALLFANGLLWPHLAWLHAVRATRPVQHEQFNLMVDSAMLGAWVAVMRFNLLPCVLLVSMMAMDRISAGGWRVLARALLLQVAACALVAWLTGFAWQPVSDMFDIVACIPMMAVYPVWLSTVNFKFARRIRQQNRLLEQLNRTDTLTGLANRAHWLETAAREMHRYLRNQRPATLILLDIDGFKLVNDRHGHAAGDALLQELAAVLRESLRSVDTPGRLGGDEFGVVLPETGLDRAREVAERIRQRVERIGHIDDTLVQPCTLSLGVAEVGPRHANVEAWIRQADIALYLAKTQGRNRVCANPPEVVAH